MWTPRELWYSCLRKCTNISEGRVTHSHTLLPESHGTDTTPRQTRRLCNGPHIAINLSEHDGFFELEPYKNAINRARTKL